MPRPGRRRAHLSAPARTAWSSPGSERIVDAVDGGTVQLTLNSDLQWYMQQMIAEEAQKQGAQGGTVTVVEVKTGKIRAAAEWPSMDPNDLDASSPETWGNKLFTHDFEPGSTFKAITAAAIMDAAGATPLSTVTASSRETFPERRRHQRRVLAPGQQLHAGRCADRLLERGAVEVRRPWSAPRSATTTSSASASASRRSDSPTRSGGILHPVERLGQPVAATRPPSVRTTPSPRPRSPAPTRPSPTAARRSISR